MKLKLTIVKTYCSQFNAYQEILFILLILSSSLCIGQNFILVNNNNDEVLDNKEVMISQAGLRLERFSNNKGVVNLPNNLFNEGSISISSPGFTPIFIDSFSQFDTLRMEPNGSNALDAVVLTTDLRTSTYRNYKKPGLFNSTLTKGYKYYFHLFDSTELITRISPWKEKETRKPIKEISYQVRKTGRYHDKYSSARLHYRLNIYQADTTLICSLEKKFDLKKMDDRLSFILKQPVDFAENGVFLGIQLISSTHNGITLDNKKANSILHIIGNEFETFRSYYNYNGEWTPLRDDFGENNFVRRVLLNGPGEKWRNLNPRIEVELQK